MGKKPLVVVGIDPGTTAGYAVLDLNGNVLSNGAAKEFSVSDMISHTIQYGRVLAVGTDKRDIPKAVQEFTTKVGAKVFSPKHDLSKQFKAMITEKFKTHNDHEQDALAAALFCYARLKPMIQGVEHYTEKHHCTQLQEELLEIIIKNPELSMAGALALLEQPAQAPIFKKIIEIKNPDVQDYADLRKTIQKLNEDNKVLKQQNQRLIFEAKKRFKKPESIKPAIEAKAKQLLRSKESRLKVLDQEISLEKQQLRHQEKIIKKLKRFLVAPKHYVLLKKLDNLGMQELQKKSFLSIQEGDILYIRNPAILSKAAYDQIKEKVAIVIHREPITKKLQEQLHFHFIHESKLWLEHEHDFALARKADIEKQIKGNDVLERVLREYKSTQS